MADGPRSSPDNSILDFLHECSSSIRATYPNTELPDEIASAGEAYFFPAGHVLIYEEPTTAFEVNPAFALSQCMEAIERAARHYLDQAN